ncbi:carbohydrate ABC transporter permease [Euzebya tangerina]|uniref:carbohydrate ABC transporter permease n=1 Tax=Euzebya tangerina TaxID=591198 RepID=UPI000E321429|nr:sugar ABC transporter permease [Euzebya tangerina]
MSDAATTDQPAAFADRRRDQSSRRRLRPLSQRAWAALLLAPAVIAVILFRLVPFMQAAISSFEDPDGGYSLATYEFMFTSPDFLNSLRVTLWFNLLINPFQILVALALAVLLTQKLPAGRLWRTLAYAPTAIPIAVSAIVWRVAYRPDDGPINAVLEAIGLPTQGFLIDQGQVIPSLIVMASWVGVGYWMIFLIAGLNDIPSEYYEAAAIDGAGWWRSFFHITLPLLRRPLAFVLIADTVVNFLTFAPIQILTSGGPNGASDVIMWSTYEQAYRFGDYPLAAAQVVVIMAILLVIVTVQFGMLRTGEKV